VLLLNLFYLFKILPSHDGNMVKTCFPQTGGI